MVGSWLAGWLMASSVMGATGPCALAVAEWWIGAGLELSESVSE